MNNRVKKLHDDWILAKPYDTAQDKLKKQAEKSKIILPDAVDRKERADKAFVLQIGEKVNKVQVGDKIAFLRFGPIEVEIDGDQFLFIKEEDIIATI